MYNDIDSIKDQFKALKNFKATLIKEAESSGNISDDEKQEEFKKFRDAVSNATEFQNLVLNTGVSVEMNGIVEQQIKFVYTVSKSMESRGVYVSFTEKFIKLDDNYVDLVNKLYSYFEEFSSYWIQNI